MSGANNLDYIKGAFEEYIDTHKRKLEKLQKTIPNLDIERELIVAREKIPCRKMYMGKIRIAVKPSKEQKTIQLMAISEGYKSANIKIQLADN